VDQVLARGAVLVIVVVLPVLHEEADHVVARALEQQRGDGGIHASGEADDDLHGRWRTGSRILAALKNRRRSRGSAFGTAERRLLRLRVVLGFDCGASGGRGRAVPLRRGLLGSRLLVLLRLLGLLAG